MPRRAVRDTYGIERIGNVEVRRVVKAGQLVPEHYQVDEDALETVDSLGYPGYRPEQRTIRVTVDGDRTDVQHEAERTDRRDPAADRPGSSKDEELSAAERAKSAHARRRKATEDAES